MPYCFRSRVTLATSLLAATLTVPSATLATGKQAKHLADFQNHIEAYTADVRQLSQKLHTIAECYSQGKAVDAKVKAFVKAWQSVKYHMAVEKRATPLYPPIWQAIGTLQRAVKKDKAPEVVRERSERIVTALYEGLGGVKLKAHLVKAEERGEGNHGEVSSGGPEAAFEVIRKRFDRALAAYSEGNADKARAIIQKAYLERFEGLEGMLIEQDPELVTRLEEAFNAELPGLIDSGAPVKRVRGKIKVMKESLDRAETLYRKADRAEGEVF